MAKTRPTRKRSKRKPSAFDAEQQRQAQYLRRSLALEKRVAGLVKALARAIDTSERSLDALEGKLTERRQLRELASGAADEVRAARASGEPAPA